MKNKLLILTIIGTLLPNIFVLKESFETGNVFLYTQPLVTFHAMFGNNISAAFVTDLLFIVVLFLFWSYSESRKHKVRYLVWVWVYTFVLGLAGGLPLFLYLREKQTRSSFAML